MIINGYSNVAITQVQQNKNNTVPTKASETKELTKPEIISSKDLTPEQKLEMLGIKKMSIDDMAEGIANKLIEGDI